MIFGKNTISPTTTSVSAISSTAPAAKSLACFTASSRSPVTLSASASTAELTASATKTPPMHSEIATHSMAESPSHQPQPATAIAATTWMRALCSQRSNRTMPAKAYEKLFALFFQLNFSASFTSQTYIFFRCFSIPR